VKRLVLGGSVVLIGAIYGWALFGLHTNPTPLPKYTPVQVAPKQDPKLLSIARNVGIDVSNLNLYYSTPKADNVKGASATFAYPNTIELRRGMTLKNQRILLSHEYLHYKWELMTPQDRDNLTQVYINYFSKNDWMVKRLETYKCSSTCLANESFAYACTETPTYMLTKEFNALCNSYIKNRNILFQ
jgi:hypothetical protein